MGTRRKSRMSPFSTDEKAECPLFLLCRTASRSQGRFESQSRCRRFRPSVIAEWRAPRDTLFDRCFFSGCQWLVNPRKPVGLAGYRPRIKLWPPEGRSSRRRTRPLPHTRGRDRQACGAYGVPLHIPHDRQYVLIALNRKCLESPLPDMSAARVMLVIPPHVACHEPLHPPAQIAVAVWPQNEMKMIRHEAVRQQSHGYAVARLGHQSQERGVVTAVVKHGRATVSTIHDVVANTTNRGSDCSRHARKCTPIHPLIKRMAGNGDMLLFQRLGSSTREVGNKKVECPLFRGWVHQLERWEMKK